MKFDTLITLLIWRSYFHLKTYAAVPKNAVLPSLMWDPRNYLFSCENLTLKVRLGDKINLICPKAELNTLLLEQAPNAKDLFEKIYLLNEDQHVNYETCNTSSLLNFNWFCNKEFSHLLVFEDSPLDPKTKPKFEAGKTYYLISTSEQKVSQIDQNIGGSCRGNGLENIFTLKLKVYVCTQKDIDNNMCDVCQTVSCYEKGCGKWVNQSETNFETNYLWNGTHCLKKLPRLCNSSYFQCDGLPYSYEVENNKKACNLDCESFNTSTSIAYDKSSVSGDSSTTATLSSCTLNTLTELLISTVYIPSVSVSTTTKTVITHVTKTETKLCSQSVIVTQAARAEKIYVDIEYDKKFYVTVIATIVGAILVGIFVAHACVTYFTAKRIKKQNVYYINEKENLVDTEETNLRRVSMT